MFKLMQHPMRKLAPEFVNLFGRHPLHRHARHLG
jgi:hypothetical protein